jgi:hypothetical protein
MYETTTLHETLVHRSFNWQQDQRQLPNLALRAMKCTPIQATGLPLQNTMPQQMVSLRPLRSCLRWSWQNGIAMREHSIPWSQLTREHSIHGDVDKLIENFTTTLLITVAQTQTRTHFVDRATAIAHQLMQRIEHCHKSGIEVLRDLSGGISALLSEVAVPVVFTSNVVVRI